MQGSVSRRDKVVDLQRLSGRSTCRTCQRLSTSLVPVYRRSLRLTTSFQFDQKRLEVGFESPPTADGAAVNRSAHLAVARGPDHPARLVKLQAPVIPRQVAILEQPTCLPLQVVDDLLVG